jgi:hypothetical protein
VCGFAAAAAPVGDFIIHVDAAPKLFGYFSFLNTSPHLLPAATERENEIISMQQTFAIFVLHTCG